MSNKELDVTTSSNEVEEHFDKERGDRPTTATRAQTNVEREWRTGIKERLPLISFIALLLVVCLCAGMLTVLAVSDGKDSGTWCVSYFIFRGKRHKFRLSVSVWLSTMTLVANKLIGLAFAEAVTIAWWNYAMKGDSLRQLHLNWEAGRSVFAAVKAVKNFRMFNMICLASLAFAAFSIHAPLMQSASSQHILYKNDTATVSAAIANQLPPGFAGVSAEMGLDVNYWSPEMAKIMKSFTANEPIKFDVSGCGNQTDDATVCKFVLPGVGFNFNCFKDGVDVEYPDFSWGLTSDEIGNNSYSRKVFDLKFDWSYPSMEINSTILGAMDPKSGHSNGAWNLEMELLYKPSIKCNTTMIRRLCTLTPAIVHYPIEINLGTAKLLDARSAVKFNSSSPQKSDTARIDEVVQILPHPLAAKDQAGLSLGANFVFDVGGILKALQSVMTSTFLTSLPIAIDEETQGIMTTSTGQAKSSGPVADLFVSTKFKALDTNGGGASFPNTCETFFDDPFQYVISNMREIMFRTSIAIAADDVRASTVYTQSNVASNTTKYYTVARDTAGTVHYAITVYQTNPWYALAGALLMVFSVAAITPLFWGFWNLGRKVSLSPIEMAKALHGANSTSPTEASRGVLGMVQDHDGEKEGTNAQTEDLIGMLGDIKVKYGEVAPQKLGLAPMDTVAPISRGQVYH